MLSMYSYLVGLDACFLVWTFIYYCTLLMPAARDWGCRCQEFMQHLVSPCTVCYKIHILAYHTCLIHSGPLGDIWTLCLMALCSKSFLWTQEKLMHEKKQQKKHVWSLYSESEVVWKFQSASPSWVDPEGGQGVQTPSPLENYKWL